MTAHDSAEGARKCTGDAHALHEQKPAVYADRLPRHIGGSVRGKVEERRGYLLGTRHPWHRSLGARFGDDVMQLTALRLGYFPYRVVCIAVSTLPGATAFTVISSATNASAADLTSEITAALLAQ